MRGKQAARITTLFLDIGGVLLTDGWDRGQRAAAAREFGLDLEELEHLHALNFGTFEIGKLALDEYLRRVVFSRRRSFTLRRFREFMFAQSRPYAPMIALIRGLKARHGLKIAALSNEGRELNAERVRRFELGSFIDFFVSSCYVGLRKPDEDIYRLALDVSQTPVERVVYVENTPQFVKVAAGLGIRGILHTDAASTRAQLARLGLRGT